MQYKIFRMLWIEKKGNETPDRLYLVKVDNDGV